MSYVCVLPVRDGEEHIAESIDSLLAQTVRPLRIYVIDDGSTDRTPEILKEYSDGIVQVIRHESTTRDYIRIPYLYKLATDQIAKLPSKPDYLFCASDDAKFPRDYTQQLMEMVKSNPKLVLVSGDFGDRVQGDKAPQGTGRLISYEYYKSVGGYPLSLHGWESWILVKVLMDGMEIKNFQDIRFEHTRPYAPASVVTFGTAMYCLGYSFWLVLDRCWSSIFTREIGVHKSFVMLYGYFRAMFGRYPKASPDFRKTLSHNQNEVLKRRVRSFIFRICARFVYAAAFALPHSARDAVRPQYERLLRRFRIWLSRVVPERSSYSWA
jgi:glycosyltransferase involved in cell wall biosynthesis